MKFVPKLIRQLMVMMTTIFLSVVTGIAADASFEPILNYHAASIFVQVGLPVGRLNVDTSIGGHLCTAFLISETHLMTNAHCVGNTKFDAKKNKRIPRTVSKVELEMGFVDPANRLNVRTFSVHMPPLEMNRTLDYAILKVEGNPSAKFGYLSISTIKPEEKMPLWIIGHPAGMAQQISRVHCRVIRHAKPHARRLHHTCPAIGGNSGSPVFDASTGDVIAIHHASYSLSKPDIGLAIPFYYIVKQSDLLRSILQIQ